MPNCGNNQQVPLSSGTSLLWSKTRIRDLLFSGHGREYRKTRKVLSIERGYLVLPYPFHASPRSKTIKIPPIVPVMKKLGGVSLLSILLLSTLSLRAQKLDVIHYRFSIQLSDTSHVIQAKAMVTFRLHQNHPASEISFDLDARNDSTGKGMKVDRVIYKGKDLAFRQFPEKTTLYFAHPVSPDSTMQVQIDYHGIPRDGLIISRNKFHDRTFFADNWPYRAHDWIPCHDQPSDKATVEFIVTAPDHYQVVSNGVLLETTNQPRGMKRTHWREDTPIPTKVMVIGVAPFAVQYLGRVDQVPISTWVFAENRDSGFTQYAISKKILPFYIHYIGPYPFEKLANVQSKTIFGGMENAGNIFYYENSVKDSAGVPADFQPLEPLFAHETAHQWFGDEATETDYAHLWLSEGFATYMTHLYMEHAYGEDTLRSRMAHDRRVVVAFSHTHPVAVVDTTRRVDPMELLNPNSYQKGGWVLHMLRRKLGDRRFQEGIRLYYDTYKGKNASTEDFINIMEKVSGENLQPFFKQWIFTPGQPVLKATWKYDAREKKVRLTLIQTQATLFDFPLRIAILGAGHTLTRNLSIHERKTTEEFPVDFAPEKMVLDPDVDLLFEGKVIRVKN